MSSNQNDKSLALEKVLKLFQVQLHNPINEDEKFEMLASHLDALIQSDFNALIHILYRIDVSETKLNEALSQNKNELAGRIIAKLLIERELEKIKLRAKYSK